MKIYINNLNLNLLNEYTKNLTKYNYEIIQFKEIYTTSGIYQIKNNKIYRLIPDDKPIEIYYNYYEKMTIIYDSSFYKISEMTNILGETHVSNEIVQYNYIFNPNNEIKLVIQYCKNNENKLIPFDFYFETDQNININDKHIREQLCDFMDIILEF